MIAIFDGEETERSRFGLGTDGHRLNGGWRSQRADHTGRVQLGGVVGMARVDRECRYQRERDEHHGGPAS